MVQWDITGNNSKEECYQKWSNRLEKDRSIGKSNEIESPLEWLFLL